MGHKGRKGLKHQEQEMCEYSLGAEYGGDMNMMSGGDGGASYAMGGGALSGYGLSSGTGYYSINVGGQSVDVHESELKASKKKSGRFSVFVGGQKHKLRLSQIQASANAGGGAMSGGAINISNLGANMGAMNISGGGGYNLSGGAINLSGGGMNVSSGGMNVSSGGAAGCNIVQSMEHVTVCDNDVLRVRSATPAAQCGAIEYIHQVNAVSTRPSPIAFYPYFKVKIGDTVRVLPYHIVSQGKASRRFFRFKYDGKTITVRKSAIRPVRKEYRVILDGRVMDVSASAIQPYGDNAYLVTHNGVERIVGAASVHSGVQDGAELITDDEADGRINSLFIARPGSAGGNGSDGQSMGSRATGGSDRVFGLKKKYIKKRGGKRIRRQPRRKPKSKKDLKIFDVSFCLCYQIILNGAHIVIPQHRMKQSKRHSGYMRFRYNKMVYYITPQTITQAFYAPVVGYYSIVVDEKVIVVSGREMEKHPEKEDTFIIRHGGDISEVHSTNISFLGEYVLEPDREQLTDEGESTAVSSDESCTSDSDASVSGRDEIVEDANVYTSRTFQIRRRCVATCYRIRINGSEMVVPVSQVVQCKTRPGMLRVTYYGKTYFINLADIELQYETEVTGFYSVTINGNPVILTGDDIEDHPSEGTYVCFYKNSRYVLAQTQIMYLGEYPVIQAPSYAETEVESSDTESEDVMSNVSEEEPQMCIFVNEKPNMDMTLPEPTSGSVMGWKVYIDGRFYTVPANRLKQLRNAPGFMEIIVNRKLYHVSIENIQPIMLPTVYFITIQNKPILVPAKDVRRHPTQEGYVIVRYRGQDYVIAVGELKLADGTAVSIDDIALDQEYRVTRTTRTIRRMKKQRVKSPRTCSPLCDKIKLMDDSDSADDQGGPMGGMGGGMGSMAAGGRGASAMGGAGGMGMGGGAGGMGMGGGAGGMGMGGGGGGMGMGGGAGGNGLAMGSGNGMGMGGAGGMGMGGGGGGGAGMAMGGGNGMGNGMGLAAGNGMGGGNGMAMGGGMGVSGGNAMGMGAGAGGHGHGNAGGHGHGNAGGHGNSKSRSGSKGRSGHDSSSSSSSDDDKRRHRH